MSAPRTSLATHRNFCSAEIVTACVERLVGCYRKGDAENPDVYTAALAVMLADYPAAIVQKVTDPRTGLPGRSQWLPTVAEVRHACELEMKPLRDEEARRRRREESERVLAAESEPRAKRKTFDELVDMYPTVVGLSRPRPLTDREKAQLLADLEARKDHFRSPCDSPYIRAMDQAKEQAP